MNIEQTSSKSGTHKQFSVIGYSADEISATLGFEPERGDWDGKVTMQWDAYVERHDYDGPYTDYIAIWDWKGSADIKQFSYFGPVEIIEELFPSKK